MSKFKVIPRSHMDGKRHMYQSSMDEEVGLTDIQIRMVRDYKKGMSIEEIAESGGFSPSNVRSALSKRCAKILFDSL